MSYANAYRCDACGCMLPADEVDMGRGYWISVHPVNHRYLLDLAESALYCSPDCVIVAMRYAYRSEPAEGGRDA